MVRILLADDDGAMRDLVRRALESDGHTVAPTQDGSEALEKINAGEVFDVLVSDVNMPGLDGLALAEKAAAALPTIAVLLMSGFPEQLDKAKGLKLSRVGTLPKPFTLDQAKAAVKSLIG